ncbi:hypothetical protein BH09BAC1_BH09BAC1_02910 [soil metagenome]
MGAGMDKMQFLQELGRLNPAQRRAVDTIEGPVLVIAGPGTGKTQILAARIGNILAQTDARPENILCLTYTDAGAIAMRRRLLKFIGPDAHKVTINTFHAFCNSVIKDNLDLFGIRALDSITDLEKRQLLRKLIDGFDAKHRLKRFTGEVYYDVYRLERLFSLMKTEDWSEGHICQKVEEYLETLPERPEYLYKRGNAKMGIKVGDLKQKDIDNETDKMRQLQAACREYPKYMQLMAERKRYDFDDMILLVMNEFKRNEALLRQYQEKFLYFLVDEYQDTNGAQNEILEALAGFWERPNVFVVGDDDQSIYRFQGANVENILRFNEKYNPEIILLTDNYRSSQHILDTAKHLIQNNQERLINAIKGLSKDLKANHIEYAELEVKPEIREYYNLAHETVGIAQEIERLRDEGVKLSEIALIYRNHRQADDIARYLESRNIPLYVRRKFNIMESPFIGNIITLLEYINEEAQIPHSREDLLFQILHFNFFGIEPLVTAKVAAGLRNDYKTRWREALRSVQAQAGTNLFDSNANESYRNLKLLSNNIEFWVKELHNTTLQTLFEKVMTRGGLLRQVMESPQKFEMLDQLTTLFQFIKDESVKDPKLKLDGFLRTIKEMREENISLEIHKKGFFEDGGNLVTAHSSKGLEYEYVFLLGSSRDAWDKGGASSGFKFPDNLHTRLGAGDDTEEGRRLFYVGLTRAKRQLVVSYSSQTLEGKPMECSRYVDELTNCDNVSVRKVNLPDADLTSFHLTILSEPPLPNLPMLEETLMRRILENYSLSVSHLNTYIKCPVSFYYGALLRIPSAKNAAMAFGSAVHFAMERLFRMMKENQDNFPQASFLVQEFEWYMKRHLDSFTPEDYDRRMAYGRMFLPEYYQQNIEKWNRVCSVEINLRTVVDGIPINGKLDKLEFDGKHVNVVDYKTGKFDNSKKKFFPPTEDWKKEEPTYEEKHGGDYWRQAVFYKILVDNEDSKGWTAVSTEFDFVEPDRNTKQYYKQKIIITPEDLVIVRAQMQEAYRGIQNLEFQRGCNDSNCQWCNFVKNNFQLDPSLVPETAEPEEAVGM